ncbi:MAG: OmpA family protein [Maribacter sp.]|nr:OmpA family protein [Maribacter sp.]
MKTFGKSIRILLTFFIVGYAGNVNAQLLKRLGERAEDAAQRTVERRVEKETQEKTDQALDSILEPSKKEQPNKNPNPPSDRPSEKRSNQESAEKNNGNNEAAVSSGQESPKSITVYSKFDYVPGDQLLFFDDFANDFVGDFPAKWDTNGNGEVVTVGESSEKWFELKSKSAYYPDIGDLPQDFTIEFDFMVLGIDKNSSSTASLILNLRDNNSYDWYNTDKNGIRVSLPLCQYIDSDIRVWNSINGESTINNLVETDIREIVLDKPHISIAVNGTRFRLWINETKYLDLPKLVPNDLLNYVRFDLEGLEDGKDRLFIKNLKIAGGGIDLRKKLIADGKVSTNGILFDSGSANLQPQSMGIIRQIYQVLEQEKGMKLKIVGHTDADGNDATNMELSKKRADAVKSALVSVYGIKPDRLISEGKGESEPVGDNSTLDGKAQNRRVEFIKR